MRYRRRGRSGRRYGMRRGRRRVVSRRRFNRGRRGAMRRRIGYRM